MLGMHGAAFANYAVDDCDFLIAVGARFDDRVAGVPEKFARNARRIAHLDVDRAEVNKVKRVQWSHVGTRGRGAAGAHRARPRARVSAATSAPGTRELAELKRVYAMNYDRASPLIQPYYVIEELNRQTHGEAIITTGVGQHQMWAAQYCDFAAPAAVAHLRQHGHHGLWPAGGDRRADRLPRSPGGRHRRRLRASA